MNLEDNAKPPEVKAVLTSTAPRETHQQIEAVLPPYSRIARAKLRLSYWNT
jgi:hypothetical protein